MKCEMMKGKLLIGYLTKYDVKVTKVSGEHLIGMLKEVKDSLAFRPRARKSACAMPPPWPNSRAEEPK